MSERTAPFEGVVYDGGAHRGVTGQPVQPLVGSGRRVPGGSIASTGVVSGTTNSGAPPSPLLGEHRREVSADLVDGLRRDPVEHDRDGRAAGDGVAQELPGHGVGIARGRRDEHPHVRGREQLGRELAVRE